MFMDLAITVSGGVLLLLAACAGLLAVQGRKSSGARIAPRGTGFGVARRLAETDSDSRSGPELDDGMPADEIVNQTSVLVPSRTFQLDHVAVDGEDDTVRH